MDKILAKLLQSLTDPVLINSGVIPWASPILAFGNPFNSKIATVGINPSNLEFLNNNGDELSGSNRRFHTLNSLSLDKWSQITNTHFSMLFNSFYEYFQRNPYNNWFKPLDYLINGGGNSFYFPYNNACHLDLIPFATYEKWGNLTFESKANLLASSSNILGSIIEESTIESLILNGQSVIDSFQKTFNVSFLQEERPQWALPRINSIDVKGYSYFGEIDKINEVVLNRKVKVLGFNHNIQSSYGVTKKVKLEIRNWITEKTGNHE